MQLQTMPIATKGVGEDDVGTGINELLVQQRDSLGMIGDPKLGWFARRETHLEIIGACSTVR